MYKTKADIIIKRKLGYCTTGHKHDTSEIILAPLLSYIIKIQGYLVRTNSLNYGPLFFIFIMFYFSSYTYNAYEKFFCGGRWIDMRIYICAQVSI